MWERGDVCLGPGTRGREGWDVGMRVCGDVGTLGYGDSGTWGHGDMGMRGRRDMGKQHQGRSIIKIGDTRSGMQGGEKQKEPFSALNESRVAHSQRDGLSTDRPPSVCVVCLRLELDFESTQLIG